jgi:hypothetical protein
MHLNRRRREEEYEQKAGRRAYVMYHPSMATVITALGGGMDVIKQRENAM